jgi:LysM repeat protein
MKRQGIAGALLVLCLLVTASLASAQATGQTFHIVARGESLSSIARLYNITPQALAEFNGLALSSTIFAGQTLRVPLPAVPLPPSGGPITGTTYVVQRGDTLASIAARSGTTVQALAAANNIANPNRIYAGQVLVIPRQPTVFTHVVRPGENLARIAAFYGSTVNAIVSFNHIANPNRIFPGQVLQVPVFR